ncbi:hypothetical protein MRB53_038580 [Persea americana]|nr:hypothetical protein MRB53_038580 [Persea americana]
MMSLRRFACAVPRSISRSIATSTFRTSSIITRPVLKAQIPRACIKAFSTTLTRYDASSQTLAAKLQNELQLETESGEANASQSNENVQQFLDQRDWELSDVEGEQYVKLTRKYDDETIEVSFSIADFPPPYAEEEELDEALMDEEDIEAQSGGATTKGAINQGRTSGGNFKVAPEDSIAPGEGQDMMEDDGAPQAPFAANATVTVRRDGKQGALRIELVAEDGEFSIHSIAQLDSDEAVKAINPILPASWCRQTLHWSTIPTA